MTTEGGERPVRAGGGPDAAALPGFDDGTEDELRARGDLNWSVAPEGVIASWVAEMDYDPSPVVVRAVTASATLGRFGYPSAAAMARLRTATAGFALRRLKWQVDPGLVIGTGDVMAGVILALMTLCEPGPVVVPTPAYPPFLDAVPLSGRQLITVPLDPDAERAELDLDAIEAALQGGARTVLLCNPHNPWGRAFSAQELAGLRDVVLRHRARVVADEIHAPLVLPGSRHTAYASVEGAAAHTTTVLSASKAFNIPGLKCAQIVAGTREDARRLTSLPTVANHGLSPVGLEANVAAYDEGGPWLDMVLAHLAGNATLFAELMAELLPRARMRPLEATYLAWLDVRAYGHRRPAAVALEQGRVLVRDGSDFGPGGAGHIRVNLAAPRARVTELATRLGAAFDPTD